MKKTVAMVIMGVVLDFYRVLSERGSSFIYSRKFNRYWPFAQHGSIVEKEDCNGPIVNSEIRRNGTICKRLTLESSANLKQKKLFSLSFYWNSVSTVDGGSDDTGE